MSRAKTKQPRSLVWLRRVRAVMGAEEARGPGPRAAHVRRSQMDAIITRLDLPRVAAGELRRRRRRAS